MTPASLPRQQALTFIAGVRGLSGTKLRETLARIDADVETNELIPFARMKLVHFARFVILPAAGSGVEAGREFHEQLVFSTNFDGSLDEHIDELIRIAARGLHRLFGCCVGYAPANPPHPAALKRFILSHLVEPGVFYVGAPGMTVGRINSEARLRERIESHIDGSRRREAERSPAEMRQSIRAFVSKDPSLAWAIEGPGPRVPSGLSILEWAALGAGVLLAAPLLLVWILAVRYLELTQGNEPAPAPDPDPRRHAEREDYIVQNQLSHVVELKPGWIRRFTLKTVMKAMDVAGRRVYTRGELDGVVTLHFVRWVLIDGGRRLVFLTNYDGGMLNYVEDFIKKSKKISSVLTAVWSHTLGFPESEWLILKGARDFDRFVAFLRDYQVDTQVWYSAYKRLTTHDIVNHAEIRRGLHGDMTERQLERWLQRF